MQNSSKWLCKILSSPWRMDLYRMFWRPLRSFLKHDKRHEQTHLQLFEKIKKSGKQVKGQTWRKREINWKTHGCRWFNARRTSKSVQRNIWSHWLPSDWEKLSRLPWTLPHPRRTAECSRIDSYEYSSSLYWFWWLGNLLNIKIKRRHEWLHAKCIS